AFLSVLNGTQLRLAKLHVTHPKDERGSESGFKILTNLFILNNMAERVGFELASERKFNNMQQIVGVSRAAQTKDGILEVPIESHPIERFRDLVLYDIQCLFLVGQH